MCGSNVWGACSDSHAGLQFSKCRGCDLNHTHTHTHTDRHKLTAQTDRQTTLDQL